MSYTEADFDQLRRLADGLVLFSDSQTRQIAADAYIEIRRLRYKLQALEKSGASSSEPELCKKCHQPQQMNKVWVVGEGHLLIEGCVDAIGKALRKIEEGRGA